MHHQFDASSSEHWTPEIRAQLVIVLDALKQAQPSIPRRTIARAVGITPPYLSQLAPTGLTLDEARIDAQGVSSKTPARQIVRRIVKAIWAHRTILDSASVDVLDALSQALDVSNPEFTPPGMPLPGDSEQYVERYQDGDAIEASPVKGRSFASPVRIVWGPPQVGKSSFLNRMAWSYEQGGGRSVSIWGWEGKSESDLDLGVVIDDSLDAAGIPPTVTRSSHPTMRLVERFESAAERVNAPILFVWDGLNTLPPAHVEGLMQVFRQIQDRRSKTGKFRNGCIMGAVTWSGLSDLPDPGVGLVNIPILSSAVMQGMAPITLPWFNEDEVRQVFQRLQAPQLAAARAAWALLRGQPLLTHTFAEMVRRNQEPPRSAADILATDQGKAYGESLRTCLELLGAAWNGHTWHITRDTRWSGRMEFYLGLWALSKNSVGYPGATYATEVPVEPYMVHTTMLSPPEDPAGGTP